MERQALLSEGQLSFSRYKRMEVRPDPAPPHTELPIKNPSARSQLSSIRRIDSIELSIILFWEYPLIQREAQLSLPAMISLSLKNCQYGLEQCP